MLSLMSRPGVKFLLCMQSLKSLCSSKLWQQIVDYKVVVTVKVIQNKRIKGAISSVKPFTSSQRH